MLVWEIMLALNVWCECLISECCHLQISHKFCLLPSGLPTSELPTGGQSRGGQFWVHQSSGLPTPTITFFMNCLCLIWALGEYWGQCQCIQSQYFEEQCNSCNYRRHLKTHSARWDIAGHLRTCLKKTQWKKPNKCKQCDSISNQTGDMRRHLKTHRGEKSNKCN